MKVTYFFRKLEPQFNSIEGVFGSVIRALPADVESRRFSVPMAGASLQNIWHNCRAVSRQGGDINHITGHINYIALALKWNTVLTVHDIGSSFSGRFWRNFFVKMLWYWVPALFVKRITTISEFSRQELARLIPFARTKIRVVHNPYDKTISYVPQKFNRNNPRILHIGTKPNKNLETVIEALQTIPCRLVIIGKLTQAQMQLLKSKQIDYENFYYLPYDAVVQQYERCDLVCFASTYEGFGLPIIEANAVGRPVIASNTSAMPEVAGNAACLVDPFDPASIRSGVLKVIEDSEYRQCLIENGLTNIKRFTPKKITSEYVRVYEEVLDT